MEEPEDRVDRMVREIQAIGICKDDAGFVFLRADAVLDAALADLQQQLRADGGLCGRYSGKGDFKRLLGATLFIALHKYQLTVDYPELFKSTK